MAEARKLDRSVAVAILTYRRRDMLDTALARCEEAFRAADIRAVLLVIDNDADQTARSVVKRYEDRFDEIHYHCEPRRGIPVARNRALDEALALPTDRVRIPSEADLFLRGRTAAPNRPTTGAAGEVAKQDFGGSYGYVMEE